MNEETLRRVEAALAEFTVWLAGYGETSWDHQSYFASDLCRRAKALYYSFPRLGALAVGPMIFSEAFVPSARKLFYKPQRFPIADAHYTMGFSFLAQRNIRSEHYRRAVHFLDMLIQTRCPGYTHYGWGYPFNWETRRGVIKAGTPLITTLPYVYEAFRDVYEIDGKREWLEVMRSIAEHAISDYWDVEILPSAFSCSYMPGTQSSTGVVNASAYRAFLLTCAGLDFSDERYKRAAEGNLRFVLAAQNEDGSWPYSHGDERDFVDHFHTCFVLKALAKIEALSGDSTCTAAIDKGVAYYVKALFDENRLPKPFSRAPRLTVYRRELYDYAECVNVAVLLKGRSQQLDQILEAVVDDLLANWRKNDGSFRSRKLLLSWDNIPMHRWAQAQLFRSLAFLLHRECDDSQEKVVSYSEAVN
ncbi:MAG: hypothetical protein ACJ71Q_02765 [Terriglobales bacterium]